MKKSLRVLHVITAFDRGGAENHLADLVRHQRRAGLEVTVVYLRGTGSWAAPLRALGVAVEGLGLRFYGDPRPWRRLRQILARGTFQLVHAHLPPAELYTRLALLGFSKKELPLIISKHNDCPFHRVPGERAVGRWVARRAVAVIAISAAVRRYMIGPALGLDPAKVETIYYGIDAAPFEQVAPEEVAALRREWGAGPDTVVIGFAGRLVKQKNLETLLRAFALFLQRRPGDARLVLVGVGPQEGNLRRCAAESGVAERVVWAGFRADVPCVMRAFDLFALTSVHEGFGLVLAEAMAARRPVVATRAGAISEVVSDGETGLLADPGAPAQVADALERLSADAALRTRFGEAGCRRVRECFTLEQMWHKTDALYARCLHSAAAADALPAVPATRLAA